MLIDEQARVEATDPSISCILQAPAGSGKTEVLTQRFLRLLSRVEEPEQIVALTFTRKAASEMRERVFSALMRAQQGIRPETPHQEKTMQYATAALRQDRLKQWQLLNLPHRLRITTIDALCQRLTHAMPLFERNIPYATLTDQPSPFYHQAATACFKHALTDPDYQSALITLLTHFDNRQDKVIQILSEQLQTREQWLRKLFTAQQQDQQDFEKALMFMETHEINRFKATVPVELISSLIKLAKEVSTIENNPTSPRFILKTWEDWAALNPELLQGLASLLLTSQLNWRKAFDHHVGLRRDACDKETYNRLKEESKALLESLSTYPACLEALIRVRQLPKPVYPESSWHTLQALFRLLPLLTAHLTLVWQEHHCTDFTAVATAAHQALTVNDAPTDLALYMDNMIHHLLIDEFQDTSIQQFELLSQLVEGFQEGKTVFIVGDPMQSIYRFRSAEVGLFLRAKYHGIGPVRLKFLQLACNFRSNSTLVSWINQYFKNIFPLDNDLESGAIQFHSAEAIHAPHQAAFIQARQYATKDEEAKHLLATIQQELSQYPNQTIAILVRSRHQLAQIIRSLREANIAYQGVDIDWLSALPHVQDAWIITQCLLTPGVDLAWAAFLRSPWCGLTLNDILTLSQHQGSFFEALSRQETYQTLSEEGKIRAQFCYDRMQYAILHRQQQPLAQWILNTLEALHLCSVLTDREQLDLHEYLRLIEQYEKDGTLDIAAFKKAFNGLYSKKMEAARLQIMTIHKAKGLEFDSVILPGLSAKTSQTHQPLLRWLTLPSEADDFILVSPLKATHEEASPLYDYLSKLDKEKESYEQQRLLYVAVTRAKKRLYLSDFQHTITANTFKSLLKDIHFETIESTTVEHSIALQSVNIERLSSQFYHHPVVMPSNRPQDAHWSIEKDDARLLGIATHTLLQWICTYHPKDFSEIPWNLAHLSLKQQGLMNTEPLLKNIRTYLYPLFHTPKGQWIIQQHLHEHNEYAILVKEHDVLHTRVIDRTFEENGVRWIIDFKTGQPSAKHQQQIEAYAKYLSQIYTLPIRCGLYYLASETWIEHKTDFEKTDAILN